MNKIELKQSSHIIFFIIFLPLLSVGLAMIIGQILNSFQKEWYFPLIDGLGFIGSYILLFTIFDKWAWKFKFFRLFKVVSVQNVGGRWKGEITSSFNNRTTKTPAFLEIEQTFSNIKACLYTELSFSSSLMADFVKAPNGRQEFHYEYHNEPNEKASETMHGHDGVAKLSFNHTDKELIGSYYTTNQHGRGNIGSLNFKHVSNKTCGCFDE